MLAVLMPTATLGGLTAIGSPAQAAPLPSSSVSVPADAHPVDAASKAELQAAFAKLSTGFEVNAGQAPASVTFTNREGAHASLLSPQGGLSVLSPPVHSGPAQAGTSPATSAPVQAVQMSLVGANAHPLVEPSDQLPGVNNYLVGAPSNWHTNVPSYATVRYRSVYPGVDTVFHQGTGTAGTTGIEYDFELAPGVDPAQITLAFNGAKSLSLGANGDLVIATASGVIRQLKPVVYQPVGASHELIPGDFVLEGTNRVGFRIGSHDQSRPLVIDPVLVYSSLIASSYGAEGKAISVDTSGNAYVTGDTFNTDFPTTATAFQTTCTGNCFTAYVVKLNPQGTARVYSTYLGGTDGSDSGNGIAVNGAGNAFVTGSTSSTDFPTKAALQPQCSNGCAGRGDAFVSELSSDGTALVYSTYLGGSGDDAGNAIAVDAAGDAYVAGSTGSADFPGTAGGLQPTCGSDGRCNPDATLSGTIEVATPTTLTVPNFGTLSGTDVGKQIICTCLPSGTTISAVSGRTATLSNPATTFGTVTFTIVDHQPLSDAFMVKLDPAGQLSYGTFFGGSGSDSANGIAVDASGDAYIAGATASTDLRTVSSDATGPFQPACANACTGDNPSQPGDAFVAKLNPGTAGAGGLVYSTYLGGSATDFATGIAIDAAGDAYISGATSSPTDFPTTPTAFQLACGGGCAGGGDAFVSELGPNGSTLIFSTYLGGNGSDDGNGIGVDGSGGIYVTGTTGSVDFPTKNAIQPVCDGCADFNFDAFVTKFTAPTAAGARALAYSTFLGGTGFDQGLGIAVDSARNAYVTGDLGVDFPATSGAFQSSTPYGGAFVVKIAPPDDAVPPVVTGLNPVGGPPEGGTTVDISGSGFTGASAVHFGSATASFTVRSDTQIAAVSPPHASGVVPVTVTQGGGTSLGGTSANFAYGQGAWAPTGSLITGRTDHTATLLSGPACEGTSRPSYCGKVLVAGGSSDPTAELYDPSARSWSPTGSLHANRSLFTATLLPNGKVLMVGSFGANVDFSGSSEVYDPAMTDPATGLQGSFTLTGPLRVPRGAHTATLLAGPACNGAPKPSYCGKVLIAGGQSIDGSDLASAELFDPNAVDAGTGRQGAWSLTGPMNHVREQAASVLLPSGKVLEAGGLFLASTPAGGHRITSLDSAELYDPVLGTWTFTKGTLNSPRSTHTMTVLAGPRCSAVPAPSYCGQVLIAGGANGISLNTSELYDPASDTFPAGDVSVMTSAHYNHTATMLASGEVLVAGGRTGGADDQGPVTDVSELYNPASNSWFGALPMITGRAHHTATLLNNGQVLAAGGVDDRFNILTSAELFTAPPSIADVRPGAGAISGGTTVTITGTGFTGATGVTFGGVPATTFTVLSDTQITATTPAGSSGSVDVVVTTAAGNSTISAATFSFAASSVTVAPASLAFTSSGVGQTSAAQTVTVTNSGSVPVTVATVAVNGANASSYAVTADTCSRASLAPGANCTVGVLFTPTATGTTLATLTITDSAADSPQSVALAGTTGTAPPTTGAAPPTTGAAPPTAGVTVFPSSPSLTFSAPAVGQASAAQTVTLTNSGTAAVTVSKLAVSGPDAGAFATTADTCTNATLAAGATCTVDVTFTPAATGASSATLSFTDTATGSPQTVILSGSTTTVTPPVTVSATRIAGVDRIGTAVAASRYSFPTDGSAGAVVLARADLYPDALAGVPLAAAKTAPLLLTNTVALDATTKAEITRVLPSGGTVYLLGGTAALDPAVAAALSDAGFQPVRLAGTTRFDTAVEIAKALGDPDQIFEVTGTNFPDAIAAGPAVIAAHGAILLTDGSLQAPQTAEYLAAHPADTRVAVGGPATRADPGATPVVGIDRYATAAALATRSFPNPTQIGLATGEKFPDALAGGPVLGASGPMLLVTTDTPLPAEVAAYLAAHGKAVTSVLAFGGTAVMTDGVITATQSAAGGG